MASASPSQPSSPWLRVDRLLTAVSLAWGLVVVLLPAYQRERLAVGITLGLLAAGLVLSLVMLTWKKRFLVVLNASQLFLFTLAHYQIYRAYGPEHYRVDHAPGAIDWARFGGVHVLRAADFLDFFEGYGIDLQSIHHVGPFSAGVLVAMHLATGLFLLGALAPWLGRWLWRKKPAEKTRLADEMSVSEWKQLRCLSLVICLGLTGGLAFWQHWGLNALLWPADQLARTLDVADAMQLFGWRLHSLEMGIGLGSLALLFRLTVGLTCLKLTTDYLLLPLMGDRLLPLHELAERLEGPSARTRRLAALALGRLGPTAGDCVPALVPRLCDASEAVRSAARWALQWIEPAWAEDPRARVAIPGVVLLLADRRQKVREEAERLLERLDARGLAAPEVRQAVPALVLLLATGEEQASRLAEEVLLRLDPAWPASTEARQAMPALIDRLAHWEREVRRRTERVLGRIDAGWQSSPEAEKELPRLVRQLINTWPSIQQAASESLTRMGSHAVPALVKALRSWDPGIQKRSASVLGQIGPDAQAAAPALRDLLTAGAAGVGRAAVEALGKIGPDAHLAIPRLVEQLADGDRALAGEARTALNRIEPRWREGSTAQQAALSWSHRLVAPGIQKAESKRLIEALMEIGAPAAGQIADLLQRCGEREGPILIEVLGALKEMAREAAPLLTRLSYSPSPGTAAAARVALRRIGAG